MSWQPRRGAAAIALALAGAGLLLVLAGPAQAIPAGASITQVVRLLNGGPVRQGVLTSLDGGVVTAAVTENEVLMVLCQPGTTGHVNTASTCSNSYTSADFCPPIDGPAAKVWVAKGSTLAMMPSDAGVMSCPYFYLR